MLKQNLDEINNLIDNCRKITVSMLEYITEALLNKEKAISQKIIEIEEPKINSLEIQGTQLCIDTLALYQPEAKFLRIVVTGLTNLHALERIGDMCVNISKRLNTLIDEKSMLSLDDILTMITKTQTMLNLSIDAFLDGATNTARNIYAMDEDVNKLRDLVINEAINNKNENNIQHTIFRVNVVQNLERIADLAVTIAKNVLYMTTGEVVEH